MKICILGDTHWGCRNRNVLIEKWMLKFYDEFFFNKLDELGIKTILQTGDFFDNRKWINLETIGVMKQHFVKTIQDRGIDCHVIIGNHDTPRKHSLYNNSVSQLLGNEEYFHVYDQTITKEFDGCNITFFPWICKENEEESFELLHEGGEVAFGHFEIDGFMMHPGSYAQSKTKSVQFDKWEKVISGHFHSQSEKGNIHYIGTPYQMSWSDHSTRHGFWVFDTFDKSMTFHENPFRYFHKIYWENGTKFDVSVIKDSYVKIEVREKTDFEAFEKFIDQVNFNQPFEMKVTEEWESLSADNVGEMMELASTTDLIEEYISDVVTLQNKDEIVKTMLNIHKEAIELNDQV